MVARERACGQWCLDSSKRLLKSSGNEQPVTGLDDLHNCKLAFHAAILAKTCNATGVRKLSPLRISMVGEDRDNAATVRLDDKKIESLWIGLLREVEHLSASRTKGVNFSEDFVVDRMCKVIRIAPHSARRTWGA
eukprot:738271-Amphidinium_carterae.1